MNKLKELLESFGLENNEAIVYLEALKMGTVAASIIAKNVGISRTSVRYTCEVLIKKGLMIGSQNGNTKLFTAETPNKIKNLLIMEKNKLEEKEEKLNENLDELYKLYNPYTKIPKITFYEGEDGIKKILEDHLKEGIKIYTFIDMDGINVLFGGIQKRYGEKRLSLNIKKKTIMNSSKQLIDIFNEEYLNKISEEQNQTRYIKGKKLHIASYLYNGKFSYITLKKGKFFGAIIDDEEFYNYHKSIFEFMWENASETLEN